MHSEQSKSQYDTQWRVTPDYCGRILNENFSRELKKRLAGHLTDFQNFDKIGYPAILYIAAWREDEKIIWYEYVSSRFTDILDCHSKQAAQVFNENLLSHNVYKAPHVEARIQKEVINRPELSAARQGLREEGKKKGAVEAVYQLALKSGDIIWLKDQANVEIFPQDNICISLGILTDVSKEIEAEEQLKRAKQELKRHRDYLEDLVRDRTKELWKTQLEIVYRLARAAEYRDNQTGQHINKMSHYCDILAKAAGMEHSERELFFYATSMHDVGKIGITDRILLKQGRLSEYEFELMKSHSRIGAELLSGHNSELLQMAKTIALTHHEKWDGSGYPHGLAGESIPLGGRITAICDVFDALTSDRPYKKAWSFDYAIAELQKQRGGHFDPQLVDLFMQNLPAIRNTKERFS